MDADIWNNWSWKFLPIHVDVLRHEMSLYRPQSNMHDYSVIWMAPQINEVDAHFQCLMLVDALCSIFLCLSQCNQCTNKAYYNFDTLWQKSMWFCQVFAWRRHTYMSGRTITTLCTGIFYNDVHLCPLFLRCSFKIYSRIVLATQIWFIFIEDIICGVWACKSTNWVKNGQ